MKILCFGDSNTYGYDPRSYFADPYSAQHRWADLLANHLGCQVINEGANGREIPHWERDFLDFNRMLTAQKPVDLLMIMLGTNDLLQGNSAHAVARRMEHFLEQIDLDKSRILLIGPPAMERGQWVPTQTLIDASAELNQEFNALSRKLGVGFADAQMWNIPLSFDGVHFTEEGHKVFAEKLVDYLRKRTFSQQKPGTEVTMIPCISVENMRHSDAYTIANLVPSLELMHRAAWGVFKAVRWKDSTAIVVGSGNNGGDGFALACILKEHGYACTVFTVSQRLSEDSAYYAAKCKDAGIPICPFEIGCLDGFSMVVDCLLGTGFSGAVRSNYREAIEEINRSPAYVVSVDINSGMNGNTGEAETAVYSDLTVTIGYVKTGLVAENAGKYIKRLLCADIGIVLVRNEGLITEETCPPWLDMHILTATE